MYVFLSDSQEPAHVPRRTSWKGAEGPLPASSILRAEHQKGYDSPFEEDVDAVPDGEGHGDDAVSAGHAVETADVVGQVVQDGQIVLDDNDVCLVAHQLPDGQGGVEPLLDIQVRRRLVKHEDVGFLDAHHGAGKALQLPTGQVLYIPTCVQQKLLFNL